MTATTDIRGTSATEAEGSWQSTSRRLLAELEADRRLLQGPLEELRVPVEDAHRADWEGKKRVQEISDLKAQLAVVEDQLRRQQEVLLSIARANEGLKAEAPFWEVDLQQLRAVARPRVEGLHFVPGHLPEKVGGFSPVFGEAGGGQSQVGGASGSRSGPVVTEYLPTDRQAAVQRRLDNMRKRIAVERESRQTARTALEDLMRTEAEESHLLQEALREQLARVRKRRSQVRAHTDEIVDRHLRLKAEALGAEAAAKVERLKLKEEGEDLSSKLAGRLLQRCAAAESVGRLAQQLQQRAARAHETGVLRAREDAAFLREQIDEEEERSAQRIAVLEEQLHSLRRRYKSLEGSRAQELEALRLDIEGLQRATRQCEQLAARCVAWTRPSSPGSGGYAGGRRLQGEGGTCCGKCGCSCNDENAKVEALALRPAVARLRKVLESCEHAVLMEEAGGRLPEPPRSTDSGSGLTSSDGLHGDASRSTPGEEARDEGSSARDDALLSVGN